MKPMLNKYNLYSIPRLVLIISTTLCLALQAQPSSSVSQTQTKLKQLDNNINQLKHSLSSAQDKRSLLNNTLASTEKEIGKGVLQLRSIELEMNSKTDKITALQNKVHDLTQELTTHQQLLARHIKARYQMGEYQPLKWLLNQDDPYRISRVVTYYQYLVQSRQQLIAQMDHTLKQLNEHKEMLNHELAQHQQLQLQLHQHQQQLEHNKQYHTSLIGTLNNEIKTNQHSLATFQRDKDNLSRLLKTLALQKEVHNSKPFIQMRRKLPSPLLNARRSVQKRNQGVTFFAEEGTKVTAVYPGKVVFSDWLKGYGLLLIVDHGRGFMTLYAHNQSLFKHKGQTVHAHEQIATVGHTGGIKQNGLYFEIRQNGKAVPPLAWLG